ncbi:hypothetical protein C0993_000960 [Termitomyces sp. T159_Od127]|nr:hypothetical protein C0993_000960 [Termitomyces sp. T159_Od127]
MIRRDRISTTEHAVRIQIELEAAREELSRWKRTQSSRIYAHTGPSTRRVLDTRRKAYAQTVFNLEKQLTRALSDLSELSCKQKFETLLSDETDDNEFKSYIDEVSQWLEFLRHLVPQPSPPGTEDPSTWTWNQIEASVVVLNDLCGKFAEFSLYQRYTNINSGIDDSMMGESADMNRGKEAAELLLHDERVKEVSKFRQRIVQDGEELVRLQAKLQDLEKYHSQVGIILWYSHTVPLIFHSKQMQERLDTYAQWAEEDKAKIRRLSEGVELLFMLPNPAIQPPSNILETTSEFVADESKNIATEYFGKLVALCLQGHNALLEDLDVRVLESVKQGTQGIYQRAVDVKARDT